MSRYLNKPFSPHLSIYKSQITSLFSIFHRFSSIFLVIYFFLINITILFLANLFLFNFIVINNIHYYLLNCLLQILFYFSIFHLLNGLKIILVSFKFFSYYTSPYLK